MQKPKAKAAILGKKHLGTVLARIVAALKSKQHPNAGHIQIFVVRSTFLTQNGFAYKIRYAALNFTNNISL